jgi:hypothetical protein
MANQEVETLFQTKTIVEIKEVSYTKALQLCHIPTTAQCHHTPPDARSLNLPLSTTPQYEAQTRHAIEEKHKQLRQVVGDSYRDLITSADTIIDISKQCQHVISSIDTIHAGLKNLADTAAANRRAHTASQATSHDTLYAVGSRVKFLLDTPEVIYGCLENEDFAGAGVRYATAFEVHKSLTSGGGGGGGGGGNNDNSSSFAALKSNINKRFPLLAHQWPAVRDLKDRIGEAAQEWLSNDGGATASAKHMASTLTALAHLKPLDGVDLLKTFLNARRNYVSKKLSAISSSTTLPSAQTELAAIATLVCSTIAQSGELFLPLVGISPTPLVSQILQDELSSSTQASGTGSSTTSRVSDEVFFEPEGKPPPEAAAWKAHITDMVDRLCNLSSSGVALECSQWLNQLGSLFTNQSLSSSTATALTPCTNGKDLLAVESSIVSILDKWTYSFSIDTTPASTNLPWIDISQWVLTKPVPLWPLLFEDVLLSRAKELVQSDVSQAVHVVGQLLESSLAEAATTITTATTASTGGGPGKYCASISTWSDPVYFQPTTPGRPLSASSTTTSRWEGKTGGSGGGNAWLSSVDAVCNAFDNRLAAALLASLDVCRGAAAAADSATTASGNTSMYRSATGRMTGSGSGKSVLLPERSRVLQPYVQAKCIEAAEAVAALLEQKASNVSKDSSSSNGIKAVSSALVLGRIALIIAHQSTALSTALGPAEDWQAYAAAVNNNNNGTSDDHGGGLKRTKSTSAHRYGVGSMLKATGAPLSSLSLSNEKDNPRLKAIQQRYLALASSVHQIWAAWAGRGLAKAAIADLSEDTALFSTTTAHVRGWAEIELPGEDDDAVHFPLPTAPSPAAIGLLLGACDEVERAGGCAVHDSTLRQLQWEVSSAFVSQVAAALDGNANIGNTNQKSLLERMTEAGALQLLFDVRLIQDCLAGAQQPSPNSSSSLLVAGASTSVPFKKKYGTLETKLSSKLDPIDWATYEPHLYVCKDIYVQRSHVMLGMLLKTGRGLRSSSGGNGKKTTATVTGVGGRDTNILKMAPAGQRFVYLPVNTPAAVRKQAQQQQLEQEKMMPLSVLYTSITSGGGSGTTITSSSGISAFSFSGRGGVDPASAYSFSHLDAVTKAVAQAAHAAAAASSAQGEGHANDDDFSDDEQGGVTAAGVGAAALEALKQGSSLFAGFSSSFKRDY